MKMNENVSNILIITLKDSIRYHGTSSVTMGVDHNNIHTEEEYGVNIFLE